MSLSDTEIMLQLRGLLDPLKPMEEKKVIINNLLEVDVTVFENNMRLVMEVAKGLEGKCVEEKDPQFCGIWIEYLKVISELASYSYKKGFAIRDYVKDVLENLYDKLSDEQKAEVLKCLSMIAKLYPEVSMEIKDKIHEIVESNPPKEVLNEILSIIGNASWVMPQIIGDYMDIFKKIVEMSDHSLAEDSFYIALSKVAMRNYYVVKSIVSEVITKLYDNVTLPILIFLSNLEVPPDHMDRAMEIYNTLEMNYRSLGKKEKLMALRVLANMAKNREFIDIQQKFSVFASDILAEELDEEIREQIIEVVGIPHWNPSVDLNALINALADIAVSTTEPEKLRIAAVNSLFKIALLLAWPRDRILGSFLDILFESGGEDVKSYVLDYLPMLTRLSKARIRDVIHHLIEVVGRVEEEDFLRIKAADLLVSMSKDIYDTMLEFTTEIYDTWGIVTEWSLRDSLIKLAGELLVKSNQPKDELLEILISGLKDSYIYTSSLTYLSILSKRMPEALSKYINEIIDTYGTIASVEKELIEANPDEVYTEEYYMMVETPKRLVPRIMVNIIMYDREHFDLVVEYLLGELDREVNELILREIAYNLSRAYELDKKRFKNIATKHLLRKDRLELLKQFGVIL